MLSKNNYCLINGEQFDAVPSALYGAKSNAHARQLSQSDWLIRDKQNGKFLATATQSTLRSFENHTRFQLDAMWADICQSQQSIHTHHRHLNLSAIWHSLGINAKSYQLHTGLAYFAEPSVLEYAGKDRYQRALWLESTCMRAWLRMKYAAQKDRILLEAISGYRSHYYQYGIFTRKLARGIRVEDILKVNAAPGFSEHHSGYALDISCQNEPAADVSFERTPAFEWLSENAPRYNFYLSYPRNNAHGINYEPWHWCFNNTA